MSMTVFVTGTSRGIGLALAQRYLSKGAFVYAAARSPDASRELWELERDYGARVKIVELDVTDAKQVDAAARTVGDRPLDLLINNAGILPKDPSFDATPEGDMRKAFEVNALGPMRVTQRLLSNLLASHRPIVATLTSKMGSIADNRSGGYYAYRVSKSAVNMLMKSFANDHPKIRTVLLHPGWVRTDMGGPNATVSVEASVDGLVSVITNLKPEQSGGFFDYKGAEIPW